MAKCPFSGVTVRFISNGIEITHKLSVHVFFMNIRCIVFILNIGKDRSVQLSSDAAFGND